MQMSIDYLDNSQAQLLEVEYEESSGWDLSDVVRNLRAGRTLLWTGRYSLGEGRLTNHEDAGFRQRF
jgi:hypothetical protein